MNRAWGVLIALLLLAAWEAGARAFQLSALVLPPPSTVAANPAPPSLNMVRREPRPERVRVRESKRLGFMATSYAKRNGRYS